MSRHLSALLALLLLQPAIGSVEAKAPADPSPLAKPTHKQWRTIKPSHNEQEATIQTYCLDSSGNLWISAIVGGGYVVEDGKLKENDSSFRGLLVYDAEGKPIGSYPLSFTPRAMNFAPDGTLFVAGDGRIAHVAADGKILREGDTPNVGDFEEFKKKAVEEAKKQRQEATKQYQVQLDNINKQITRIEALAKDSKEGRYAAQLKALQAQKKQWEEIIKNFDSSIELDPEQIAKQKLRVPGLAVSAQDVFVCCSAETGHGYDVWRTNYQFEDGKVIVKSLSGCCGNMDIQCDGENLVAAENGRFRVTTYDRDGKELHYFGKRDRVKEDGFGSCCNPMNVRCLSDGTVLAAESSIGNIKHFTADGKFLGTIGKANIAGGCKNVAVGYDSKRDYYYMLNTDRNHICVLVPLAEAPGLTEEEKAAKEAADGLGKRLVGTWRADRSKQDKLSTIGATLSAVVRSGANGLTGTEVEFLPNGKLKSTGTQLSQFSGIDIGWLPVRQTMRPEESQLDVALMFDGVETQTISVIFRGDDEIEFKRSYYLPQGQKFARALAESNVEPSSKSKPEQDIDKPKPSKDSVPDVILR